jgi:putative DNA primase/helicase
MIWDNIPNEMIANGLWCAWKLTENGKVPINVQNGKYARSNDKTTFAPYQVVIKKMSKYYNFDDKGKNIGGLGFGIFNDFSAVDIDHCVDSDGKLSPMAQDIIDFCQSYTEYSPSGTGIRIIFKTSTYLNKEKYYINNQKSGLEIYISENTNKYVTITGNVLSPNKINEIDISYILEKYMLRDNTVEKKKFNIEDYTDEKLLELWNTEAPGENSNENELDLALCNKLAFYLKGDAFAINEAFMASPYYQSKDPKHKKKWSVRNDYRDGTIKMAIQSINKLEPFNEFTLTDTGNAHFFAKKFKDLIKYNVDNKCWMIWNGQHWQVDTFNNIKNYAELVIEEMKGIAKATDNEEIRKAALRNVRRALQSSGKTALLKECEHLKNVPVTNADFNKDIFLFNTKSGVVDLKNKKLKPHNKDMMISKISPYEISYDEPKRWIKFLNEIFDDDKEIIHYVQKIFGYGMTGSMAERCMFMLIGDGMNGKSVLLETIRRAMGDYGTTSDINILLDKKTQAGGNLGDVARLNGMRYVVTNEAELTDKLKESAIKTMTSGNDNIVARFLYGEQFEFEPIMKIFMASNYKPTIRGQDRAIWDRIRMILFHRTFDGSAKDKTLQNKLNDEIPQIIGWMIHGAILWQEEGLEEPDKFKDAKSEYRSEMDVVRRWVEECCVIAPNFRATSLELFKNFSNYVAANKEYQLSHTMFGRNLGKKFEKRNYTGKVTYLGLKIHPGNKYILSEEEADEI